MNEELDSQLSAMFDDELPEQQCELVAKRLARDDALKARWGRYAAIGAAIRADRSVRLDGNLARRVSAAISAEAPLSIEPNRAAPKLTRRTAARWWQPAAGIAVAASVAVLSILWLRGQEPASSSDAGLLAQIPVQTSPAEMSVASEPENVSDVPIYTVPPVAESQQIVPAYQVAKYMVAHSEYSTPVNRRALLSAFLASESGTAAGMSESEQQAEDELDNAP